MVYVPCIINPNSSKEKRTCLDKVADGRARGGELCFYVYIVYQFGQWWVLCLGFQCGSAEACTQIHTYIDYIPCRLPCASAFASAPPQRCCHHSRICGLCEKASQQRGSFIYIHTYTPSEDGHSTQKPNRRTHIHTCNMVLWPHDRSSKSSSALVSLMPRDLARA